MKTIEKNDIVTLTFIGTLDNGEQFMTRDAANPLAITIGKSELPPTVENSIIGMQEGQSRIVTVDPDEGYGARQRDLLQTITNKDFIKRLDPKPGMIVSLKTMRDDKEVQVPATILEVAADKVVIDYNHPLAGHNLTYNITITDIQKGTN